MPKRMSVDYLCPRREIEELKGSGCGHLKARNAAALFTNLGRCFLERDGNLRKSENEAGNAYNPHNAL